MNIRWGLVIWLVILCLLAYCVDLFFDQPIYKYISLWFEYLTLPNYSDRSDEVLWAVNNQYNHKRLNALSLSDEELARIKFVIKEWEKLGLSPDKRFIIAIGEDYETITVLDREQGWKPKIVAEYDRITGFSYSSDQKYLLTYGCTDGTWQDSGFFCFHGGSTLWDGEGNKLADFTSQDEVVFAGFTNDMKHVVTQGCDSLWTPFHALLLFQQCFGASTRYYDLQGNLEGILLDRKQEIHSVIGHW